MNINITNRTYSENFQHLQPVSSHKSQSSVSFLDAMKAAKTDTVTVSNTPDLKKIYDQLSPAAKDVLERMKNGKQDIGIKEWSAFCGELEKLGAISEEDYFYARGEFQLIPVGALNPDGSFSQYVNLPISSRLHDPLSSASKQSISGLEHWSINMRLSDVDHWCGNPLQYLNAWRSTLLSWRSELSLMKNPDGFPMYQNLSPITEQANSCEKVMDVVKNLMQMK